MAAHGARRLGQMVAYLEMILGVELLRAAQGIDFHAPLQTSVALQRVISRARKDVATMGEDRHLAPDLEDAAAIISSGDFVTFAGISVQDLSLCPPLRFIKSIAPSYWVCQLIL